MFMYVLNQVVFTSAELSFTRPSQLLAIYSDMEEANLSLIQHSQASEELLEKVQLEISQARVKEQTKNIIFHYLQDF